MSSGIPPKVRELIYTRDGHLCARCACSIVNAPSSIHHRKPRQMGGSKDPRISDPRNLIRVCGTGTTGCHNAIESYRAKAYDEGWLLRSLDDLDRPLRTIYGTGIRLLANGSRVDEWPWGDDDGRHE